jgi:hypothetical protein
LQTPNPPDPFVPGHHQDETIGAAPHSAGVQVLAEPFGG